MEKYLPEENSNFDPLKGFSTQASKRETVSYYCQDKLSGKQSLYFTVLPPKGSNLFFKCKRTLIESKLTTPFHTSFQNIS